MSSPHFSEGHPHRRWSARRGWPALLFALGSASGFVAGAYFHDASKAVARPALGAEVQRANGEDSAGGPDVALAPARHSGTPASSLSAARHGREKSSPARRAARAALPITAWVTDGSVYGAGFLIDEHHLLTCLHVVEKMKTIRVSVAEGPEESGQVVEQDAILDLAIVSTAVRHTNHAELASVTSLMPGDPAFSMGSPRKLGFSLSSGVVSYVGRRYDDVLYLQTDIPTNPGSSGGPVLDGDGRVIGIASFILRETQGLAFALPIDYAYERFRKYFAARLDEASFDAWKAERTASLDATRSATRSAAKVIQ